MRDRSRVVHIWFISGGVVFLIQTKTTSENYKHKWVRKGPIAVTTPEERRQC